MSPARRLLEDRIASLSRELDTLFADSRERARRESAEQLNQAVRRLRIATDPDELCGTLESAAALFAHGVLLLRVEDDTAHHERVQVDLATASALAAAIESREPQTAAVVPSQLGPDLTAFLDPTPGSRAVVFPVEACDQVTALLCCWGATQNAALELLTQVAGVVWSTLTPPEPEPVPAPPPEFISIAPAPVAATTPRPPDTWESLPPSEQQVHLRAQRFARVHVAEMRLYEADSVQIGRNRGDLYEALRDRIDAARQSFHEQFFETCPSMVDYLHLELLRTLANDDPDVFGKDYPGPLV